MASTIPAAGTLPWRVRDGALEVALIHRPRYRDWSWPKGKLDPGEGWPEAAVRETQEETGLGVRLGIPLPTAEYMVLTKGGTPAAKTVHYWAASVTRVGKALPFEVDEVVWLDVAAAHARLDYARDREQLLLLTQAHQGGWLDTRPFALVRHAKAVARSDFKGADDRRRPLDDRGMARAHAMVPLLAAYGIRNVVTSASVRCVDTVAPYAKAVRVPVVTKQGLTEESFERHPAKALRQLEAAVTGPDPALVCSHGPLLPELVDELIARVDDSAPLAPTAQLLLHRARGERLVKGEALVCHLRGEGDDTHIVAVERHLP